MTSSLFWLRQILTGVCLTFTALPLAAAPPGAPILTDSLDGRRPSSGCDEACLTGTLDRYLAALQARNPAEAPLASGAKYTENNVALPFGEGLWRTFDSVGSYKHVFADDDAGQVGMFAVVRENGIDQLLMLRLKVDAGKVSEAEAIVQRSQGTTFINTKGLTLKPVWAEPLAAGDHPSRKQLIAEANHYFDGLSAGDGDIVPFADTCERMENGIVTAGVTTDPPAGATPTGGTQRHLQGCRAQFNGGGTTYIQAVTPRRYLVVDKKRGIVFGVFLFQHPGDKLQARGKDGTSHPMPASAIRPFTVPVAEMFKIVGGKIVQIEAIMTTVPYGMPSAW